jgi:hypothetical protein
VRPQPLPLIDQEKRHLLYLNRHHASIVMTSVVSASIAWNPFSTAQAAIISAFNKVLLSEIADEPSLAVPLVQMIGSPRGTATEAFRSSQIRSKI